MFRLFAVVFALCLIKDAFPAPVKKDHCSDAMDIAFILDASTDHSITQNIWKAMLHNTKKFVNTFGASEEGNHYAVMTFSNKPHIEMNFNTYNGTDLNSEKIDGVIDGLERKGGYTFIDKAFLAAETQLFTFEAGMRQNARKVAFVITDGIQTKDRGDFTPLSDASKGLKSKDVEVYAIGVGEDIDVLELLEMATSEDYVYSGRYIASEFLEFKKIFCGSVALEIV